MDVEPSLYYQHTGKMPLASRISYVARQRMFERFMAVLQPGAHDTVLDIGVTSDTGNRESNYFEEMYPYKSQITCVGPEDASHLETVYPGVRFRQIVPNARLPFDDHAFDIAFSNAVLEHAGDADRQRLFVAEACRVARRVFITTPNRWFPIEPHTRLPLVHYLPKRLFRRVLSGTRYSFWASEDNLNLFTSTEFRACFDRSYPVRVEYTGIGVGFLRSNLIGYTKEQG
jgi:SAM-dependent methyltransferase